MEALHPELDPLEEHRSLVVGVLVGVDDVAAVVGHEAGDGGHEPGPVRCGDQQAGRGRLLHCRQGSRGRWNAFES